MSNSSSNTRPALFILKLEQMLRDHTLQGIIAWTQDGAGVLINDRAQFEAEVLPAYFKKQRYESFLRQLKVFGFSRDHKDKED